MLCVGCGSDLTQVTDRPTDRRRLASPTSSKVVTQWKQLALEDEQVNESELDSLVADIELGKMCRKSFSAYERFYDLKNTLRCNVSKFLDATSMADSEEPTPAKRPCYTPRQLANVPKLKKFPNTSAKSSPPVVVSH